MKKNLLKTLLCCCLAAAVISGCDGQTATLENGTVNMEQKPADDGADKPKEETSDKPDVEPEDKPDVEPEDKPDIEPEDKPDVEPAEGTPAVDWLSAHGFTITPQGRFSYDAMAYDENKEDLATFTIMSAVAISETTEGVEEGYKIVTATWYDDTSAKLDVENSKGFRFWRSAFDRYTGISFEFDSEVTHTEHGGSSSREGYVTIINGDESYDVSVSFGYTSSSPTDVVHFIAVTCPVDYDGVVFYIGPSDNAKNEASSRIDHGARLYTIDELPFYGDGYYFFSYSNM